MKPTGLNQNYEGPGSGGAADICVSKWRTQFDESGLFARSDKVEQLNRLIQSKKWNGTFGPACK